MSKNTNMIKLEPFIIRHKLKKLLILLNYYENLN